MQSEILTQTIDLEIGEFYASEVEATFLVEFTLEERESFSWGQPRGYDITADAKLISFPLGGMQMTRESLIAAISIKGVQRVETLASGQFVDSLDAIAIAAE